MLRTETRVESVDPGRAHTDILTGSLHLLDLPALEYFNKAIEESIAGRPYSIYVAPHVWIPVIHIADAVRAFVELADAPKEAIRTVNYTVLGPTPAPTAQELVDMVKARISGAKLDFKVDERVSALISTMGIRPFDDHCARSEWGWTCRFGLAAIIDSFKQGASQVAVAESPR